MSGVVTDPAAWVLIAAHVAALLMLNPALLPHRLRDFMRTNLNCFRTEKSRKTKHA